MARLSDKVALVTGAARGLGAAIAKRFSEEGAKLVLTDILVNEGQETAKRFPNAVFLEQDVSDEARWREVTAKAVEHFGRLDILVNNAGWVKINEIETSTLEEFRQHERVILEGAYLGCKYALRALKAAGGGSIVNISALAAERGVGSIPAYSAVKAGIHGLSRALAMDFKNRKYNIRVNCVAPGAHDTAMLQQGIRERGGSDPNVAKTVSAGTGQPEDVANAVLFFACDESRNVNGQVLIVDSGASVGC